MWQVACSVDVERHFEALSKLFSAEKNHAFDIILTDLIMLLKDLKVTCNEFSVATEMFNTFAGSSLQVIKIGEVYQSTPQESFVHATSCRSQRPFLCYSF